MQGGNFFEFPNRLDADFNQGSILYPVLYLTCISINKYIYSNINICWPHYLFKCTWKSIVCYTVFTGRILEIWLKSKELKQTIKSAHLNRLLCAENRVLLLKLIIINEILRFPSRSMFNVELKQTRKTGTNKIENNPN